MTNAYVTEIIWHFAGYLQIFETADADRDALSGGADLAVSPGYTPGSAGWIAAPPEDEAAGSAAMRINLNQAGPAAVPKAPLAHSAKDAAARDPGAVAQPFHGPLDSDFAQPAVGAGVVVKAVAVAGATPYVLNWGEGGDARLVDILQSNRLGDADVVFNIGEPAGGEMAPRLAEMAEAAITALPGWLGALPAQGYEWGDFFANRAQDVFPDAPYLAPGLYLDGARIGPEDAPIVDVSVPEANLPAKPSLEATGNVIATGDNLQINQGVIVDAMTSTRTLVVTGDVHQRDVILQVIVQADADDHAGASPVTDASVEDGLFANLASFSSDPYGSAIPGWIPKSGLSVNVDVADTSILDVRMLAQRNIGDDADAVAWSGADAWTQMVMGGNIQINDARLLDMGADYDVIIILGNYYSLNLIVQIGVLDDTDLIATGPEGGGPIESGGGGDVVFNEAAIVSMGVEGWAAMPSGLDALATALGRGEDPGVAAFAGLAGAATGRLDVLVVKGDWYDVNIVWQINMLSDADQLVLAGEDGAFVATGGNMLVNAATIMDFGAINGQFAGGDVYHDLMLFQANIAYEDPSAVVHRDADALATEFIAFLESDSMPTHDDAGASTPAYAAAYEDALGGVMA